jgi:hypothetical protein
VKTGRFAFCKGWLNSLLRCNGESCTALQRDYFCREAHKTAREDEKDQ